MAVTADAAFDRYQQAEQAVFDLARRVWAARHELYRNHMLYLNNGAFFILVGRDVWVDISFYGENHPAIVRTMEIPEGKTEPKWQWRMFGVPMDVDESLEPGAAVIRAELVV